MGHYAEIDDNDIVLRVIVAEQDFIDSGIVGDPSKWIKTSYNTRQGVYYTPNTNEPDPDQSKALRKNYAGVGFKYDRIRDAFIPPKPYDSWILNEQTCGWEPPVPCPDPTKYYEWNEEIKDWVLVELQ